MTFQKWRHQPDGSSDRPDELMPIPPAMPNQPRLYNLCTQKLLDEFGLGDFYGWFGGDIPNFMFFGRLTTNLRTPANWYFRGANSSSHAYENYDRHTSSRNGPSLNLPNFSRPKWLYQLLCVLCTCVCCSSHCGKMTFLVHKFNFS